MRLVRCRNSAVKGRPGHWNTSGSDELVCLAKVPAWANGVFLIDRLTTNHFAYPLSTHHTSIGWITHNKIIRLDRQGFGGGEQARWYDNSGSFAVTTRDLSAFLEFGFGRGFVVHLGYRDVDYNEAEQDWDDYRAKIAEASIGYRW